MKFEDEYADALLSLESAIVNLYRRRSCLFDKEGVHALDALIAQYNAEQFNRSWRGVRLVENADRICQSLHEVSEWRLGHGQKQREDGGVMEIETPVQLKEILGCLKRIKKSTKFWTNKNGKQGYLRYVNELLYR
ncbi:MAG: hypothetical protein AB8G77_03435 [Rhodothermales bacterium]